MTRKNKLFMLLSGFFITNAILGELIGSKLIQIGPFGMSMGVLPWPVVLVATDLMNEYFGREGVKKITFVTVGLIIYAFAVLFLAIQVPAASFSPVNDEQFSAVFGQSLWIIFGSIIAFMASQWIDVMVFWFFKNLTKGKYLWLRASGSTALSQLVDSFVIIGIAFWLPGKVQTADFLNVAVTNYSYKFIIAVASTPVIYMAHYFVDQYLSQDQAGGASLV